MHTEGFGNQQRTDHDEEGRATIFSHEVADGVRSQLHHQHGIP